MAVSKGFQEKIKKWVRSEENDDVVFRPFVSSGNPYKAKCLLIGAHPIGKLEVDEDELPLYIESLVDWQQFCIGYSTECPPRELAGVQKFLDWYESLQVGPLVWSFVNALELEEDQTKAQLKKENKEDYKQGSELLQQVIQEFTPKVLVLYGSDTVKQFREQFAEQLNDRVPHIQTVKELELEDAFATLQINNEEILVFACRHVSMFNKEDKKWSTFREKFTQSLI